MKLLIICLLLAANKIANGSDPTPTDTYSNQQVLQAPDLFYLYWNQDDTDITFEIHYKNTSKWILFGLYSPSKMYSDVVVAWVNDDLTGHFSNRKLINSQNLLTLTQNPQWTLLNATNSNEYRILTFTRKIKPCDPNNNFLDIQQGAANTLVYASGQMASDINGMVDFRSATNKANVNLLTQTSGPFTCWTPDSDPAFASTPTSNYLYEMDLIENTFKFFWNFTDTELMGELHCKTTGWIGFGLSPNGEMANSNVIIGWVNSDGTTNFTIRHIDDNRNVLVNQNQSTWTLLYSAETNGYTIIKFKRPIVLCGSEDMTIDAGSPNIIFSFGLSDPMEGEDIGYHFQNRGSKVVNLISAATNKNILIPNQEIFSYSVNNVILPSESTYYYCKGFKVPLNFTQKRHILKWELLLPKINANNFHHIVIYECLKFYNGTPGYQPGSCFTNPIKNNYCQVITLVWAYGGDATTVYPEGTGYPIGGDTDYSFFVMEVHYNNPEQRIGYIDSLTVNYYMTTNLQPNELGVLTIGANEAAYAIAIPPNVESFGMYTLCSSSCISKVINQTNITIIAATPHTHLAGTEISTKIIRNGIDIGYLFRNKHYNFDYQQNFLLKPPINVTANDNLVTYCGYNSIGRDKFTNMGFATQDEMCFQFLTYYPRSSRFKFCVSSPTSEEVGNLMFNLNNTGDITIPFPFDPSSYDSTVGAFYYGFQQQPFYTDNVIMQLETLYRDANVDVQCNLNPLMRDISQVKASNEYIEVDVCKVTDSLTTPMPTTIATTTTAPSGIGSFLSSLWNLLLSFFKSIF